MKRGLVETPTFSRALKKFTGRDRQRQNCVAGTLLRMGADVFDPRLKTHGLSGDLAGRYSSSCGYDRRIVFELVKDPKPRLRTSCCWTSARTTTCIENLLK